jgi:hypothetical protein
VIVCAVRREGHIGFSVHCFGYGLHVRGIVVEFTAGKTFYLFAEALAVFGVRGMFHWA